MGKFVKLFEPGKIGMMEVKNRIIMSPAGSRYATQDGYTTDHEIAMWEARAKGGVGLIVKTLWAFSPAFGPVFFPGHLEISDDEHVESAKRFTRAMKIHGAKVACFISHPGKSLAQFNPNATVIAPSAIRDSLTGTMPRELTKGEIEAFVEEFAEGARRGKMAGFDAVMFQGGHGYLIHQFLSPWTNKRTDEYGGNVANRARFACEIIKCTRKKVGPDFPIMFRMNGDDHLEAGIRLDEAIQQAPLFVEAGADSLDISSGPREAHHWQFITHIQPFGALVHLSEAIKKVVKVPVCTVGKISPTLAENILQEGAADFVGFCRSLLADPEWPNKVKEGRLDDIRPCIYCNQCTEAITQDRPCGNKEAGRFCCSVNPALGWELEYKREMQRARSSKKVMVIGGGLAGMEAARTLADRGHEATLYEKSDRLGGQWNIVSAYRPEYADLVRFLSKGLEKAGVKVFLNKEVTPQMVHEAKPNAIVVATGAIPLGLDVQGSDSKNVVLAVDVLTGKMDVGKKVVIIGGRSVGLDSALFLAERGKKVSVVEIREIAWGIRPTLKLAYWEYLIKYGVYTYPNTVVDTITENGVIAICGGEIISLKADTVVLAVGSKSEGKLVNELKGLVPEVYTVGDCIEPRDALSAINEASAVGRII